MIVNAATEVQEWLGLKITTGAYAQMLLAQLALHRCRVPQPFGDRSLLVDVHAVFDQIGAVEGAPLCRPHPTKPATEFKRAPLKGLWHQHWFQASFMPTNLLIENSRSGVELMLRRLRQHYGGEEFMGKLIDETDVKLMAHASVNDAFEQRAQRSSDGSGGLTGEWIVFAKSNGRNIYLTLAGHEEDDTEIYRRCASALREYPELAELPTFKVEA